MTLCFSSNLPLVGRSDAVQGRVRLGGFCLEC
jgi:hypothetical protein